MRQPLKRILDTTDLIKPSESLPPMPPKISEHLSDTLQRLNADLDTIRSKYQGTTSLNLANDLVFALQAEICRIQGGIVAGTLTLNYSARAFGDWSDLKNEGN